MMSQDIWTEASLITDKTKEGEGLRSAELHLVEVGGVHCGNGNKRVEWQNKTYMLWVYSMTIYRQTRAVHRQEIRIGRFEAKISFQHTEVRSTYGMSEVGMPVKQQRSPWNT